MGKRQAKKTAGWSMFGKGILGSGAVYLAEILLFALLLVKGIVLVERVDALLAVGGAVAAFLGSVVAVRTKAMVPMLACLLQSALFAMLLLLSGCLLWDGLVWGKSQLWLLLCVMIGGLLPGVMRGRGGKRRRWK